MDPTYSPVTPEDYEETTNLAYQLALFLTHINWQRIKTPKPGFRDFFKRLLLKTDHICYLARKDGKAVGYVLGKIRKQTDDDLLEFKPAKEAEIIDLFVLEEYRGQGIGHGLLSAIENYFRGQHCTSLELMVMTENPVARKVYSNFGFKDFVINVIKPL